MNLQMIVSWLQARIESNGERGAAMVEYALLCALIAVLLIGALTALRGGIESTFNDVVTAL